MHESKGKVKEEQGEALSFIIEPASALIKSESDMNALALPSKRDKAATALDQSTDMKLLNLQERIGNRRDSNRKSGILASDSSRKVVLTKNASNDVLKDSKRDSLGSLSNKVEAKKYSFGDNSIENDEKKAGN